MTEVRLLRAGSQTGVSDEDSRRHILLVVDQFPRALGGGERIVLKIAERLPAYGYRTSILTFAADEGSAGLVDPPCPIYLLPLTRTYDWRAVLGAFALRRFLREREVALVHTCFESSDLWAGGMTKLLSPAKLVWNRRDMGILRSRKHAIAYRMLARMPDAVLAVSEQVRRYSIDIDKVPPERVATIHNGLDLARWPERRTDRNAVARIACLGNIRRVKGHDVLLQAFAKVRREFPEAKLAIGGATLDAAYMAELQVLLEQLGLTDAVSFEGNIHNQQKFLERASIFVLPSRSEGFSNAIVEAMAASLPVVATDVGGNAEAIVDGSTGFLVASEDVEGMAAAILSLMRDPTSAARMGLAGRQRVREHFTTEVMMQRIASTFTRLLQPS